MIYLDSCALLKFIKPEKESEALRAWRAALPEKTELLTSDLTRLEITRTLHRAAVDPQRVAHYVGQAVRGVHLIDLTTTVLARAMAYQTRRLGTLDSIHLATADPFRVPLTAFVTYDHELAAAAADFGLPVHAPA
ncbi:type II toxin-antitoxin system VapC family toxin [Streptomyces sp. H27-D2]|uniref:type II toxin-antitoxin system VapC family toxin n=1 Tax=Streptomyces sp. H27-D2 TaxID=3046304 RepID=UPI002DBCEC30|nr:type II toxin-antitoxin system VapC family toxin [Streptomyces sp. H27-D2]MEC4016766.1 type II toxin-antitoxin system VapC family toxin [Streptomyces sp. H27-D2]